MELLINNYPVKYEFGDEKNLESVIKYVSEWAAERGLVFNEVIIDDNHYLTSDIPDTDIDNVQSINCILHSVADLVVASLEEGREYCERAAGFLDSFDPDSEKNVASLKDIADGCEWMAEMVSSAVSLLNMEKNTRLGDKTIGEWISEIASLKENLIVVSENYSDGEAPERVRQVLGNFSVMFRMILMSNEMKNLVAKSVDSPESIIENLKKTKESLEGQLESLEEAAAAFQTGKDSEGMEKLNSFIEFIFNYNRSCYQVAAMFSIDLSTLEVDGVTIEEKNSQLLEYLTSLVHVMEDNDIIGLSDILEYEIKPLLEDLDLYIDELLKSIT